MYDDYADHSVRSSFRIGQIGRNDLSRSYLRELRASIYRSSDGTR
jgi:hypothetical protein